MEEMGYKEICVEIKKIDITISDLENQITTSMRDKTGMSFTGLAAYNEPKISAGKAQIQFDAYHGYYGSSSCYGDMSPDLARYVLLAIRSLKNLIISRAIEIAKQERAKLAGKAGEDALRVLALADEDENGRDPAGASGEGPSG